MAKKEKDDLQPQQPQQTPQQQQWQQQKQQQLLQQQKQQQWQRQPRYTLQQIVTTTSEIEVPTTIPIPTEPPQDQKIALTPDQINQLWQDTLDAQNIFEEEVIARREQGRLNWERNQKNRQNRLEETIENTVPIVIASEITPFKPKVSNRCETAPNNTVVDSGEPTRPQTNPNSNSIPVNYEQHNCPQIKFESNRILVDHEESVDPKSNKILIDPGINDEQNLDHILLRTKRQFGEIIATVALIGSISAAVSNYLTKDQMNDLSKDLNPVQTREENMIHYLNGSQSEIAVSRDALIHLGKTTIELSTNLQEEIKKQNIRLAYLFMKQSIRDLQAVFDSYHNILQHALNGKLAINTLSVRAIHDALLDLKRIGKKRI